MKTCTKDNCVRAHRARGLCASHYNQEHAPNRHAKKLAACTNCGKEVLKGTGGGRIYGVVCSDACRAQLTHQHSTLPKDHWALWFGKASAWPRYPMMDCAHCESSFVPKAAAAKYCSARCSGRVQHINRALREGKTLASVTLADARNCAWCDQPYHHASQQRVHCSDVCRDEDRTGRGSTLHHGWIHKSIRLSIYERDGHMCWLCGDAVDYNADPKRDDWAPSLDHVLPRSKGGTHEASNLRTAHRWCNSVRSDNEQHDLFALVA